MDRIPLPKLTASEISSIWASYMADSMSICGMRHFLAHLKDDRIQTIVEYALQLALDHMQKLSALMKLEGYPLPTGFTEQDVNLEAPPLFSDNLILMYIGHMAKLGLTSYTLALTTSVRQDVVDYYTDAITTSLELHNRSQALGLEMGIYVRPPVIAVPDQAESVHDKAFLGSVLGHKRPLLGVEINHLFHNLKRNALGKALILAFCQVSKSEDVKKFFKKGVRLSQKQIDVFTKTLQEDSQPAPMLWDGEISSSVISPFSEKLMMFHVSALIASAIGQYGASIAGSPRKDLVLEYTRLGAEIMQYAEEGALLMIRKGWMEYPPQSVDRRKLTHT
ncbi:DUF3231 family protein [Paenibacillus sp. YN15]|uniref:DUF3231 family protein n=1 Tax=Paenibacillus sp. YN15 TaxID=1742774 RepID=UPI0015ECC0E2|nr:DUF3231 family protein [Paenibacillus sp. YN15]